jgi:pantoate--beta-alanine ligase
MAEDLNIPITIRVCPTVREVDGLALSSRNMYLSPAEREQARAIYRSLMTAVAMFDAGERDALLIAARMRDVLARSRITRIDYIALVDPVTLGEVPRVSPDTLALVAVHVGGTRLIDNTRLT